VRKRSRGRKWQNIKADDWCKEKNRGIKNGMMTNVAKL
jgi:hypothetical protein